MIKNLELLARKQGASHEEFMRECAEVHGRAVMNVPGVRGYILHDLMPTAARTDIIELSIPEIDTIAEIWFDSLEARRELVTQAPLKNWLDGRRSFVGKIKSMVAREDTIIPVPDPRPGLKNLAFVNRCPGLTLEEFRNEWHVLHGPMAIGQHYLRGFVLNDIIAETPPDGIEPLVTGHIEGCAEAYYDSPEDQDRMIATPEAKEWFKHGAVTFGNIKARSTHEIVIMKPQQA
jgi:Methylmuconolactone methyl-isomerase